MPVRFFGPETELVLKNVIVGVKMKWHTPLLALNGDGTWPSEGEEV